MSRINPESKTVEKTVPVGRTPSDLAVGAGGVWVSNSSHTLTEIAPDTGVVVRTRKIPGGAQNPLASSNPSSVAAGRTDIWATTTSTVARMKPPPLRPFAISDAGCCQEVAVGEGSLWVTVDAGVVRIDPRTGAREARVRLPFTPRSIAAGARGVWVTDQLRDAVWRIDPRGNQVARTIAVGSGPAGVAVGAGSVWVASADGTVSRIDPSSNRVIATIAVGGTPQDVAVGDQAVWVTVD